MFLCLSKCLEKFRNLKRINLKEKDENCNKYICECKFLCFLKNKSFYK